MHFKDTETNDSMLELGYVEKSILTAEQVKEARDILEGFGVLDSGEGFQNIVNLGSYEKKKQLNRAIIDFLHPKVEHLFKHHIPFIGSFAVKHLSKTNNVPLHLDWSVLDETKKTSYNVWVSLEDMRIENGCMGMLKGSHRFGHTIRGSLINNIASHNNSKPILSSLKENYTAKSIEMNAGNALIYDHRMAHYSYPNRTEKPRVAISMVMVPKDAQLLQYHFEQDGSISIFELNSEFYLKYDMESHPEKYLKKIATFSTESIQRVENQLNPSIHVDGLLN